MGRNKNLIPDIFSTPVYEGFKEGATFGFAPKAEGALAALMLRAIQPGLKEKETFAETYRRARDAARTRSEEIQAENRLAALGGNIAGGAGLFGGLSKVRGLGKVAQAPKNLSQAVAQGAGAGALYAAGRTDSNPDEVLGDYGRNIAGGATLGGLLGVPTYGLQKGIGALTRPFKRKPLPREQQQALELSQKFGVPLTPGQVSQNLKQQTIEGALESGAEGAKAASIMKAFNDMQRQGFQDAVKRTGRQIGKGDFVERGASLEPVVSKITGRAASEDAAIKQAYDAAKQNIGFLDLKTTRKFPEIAKMALVKEAIAPENAPKAYSQLQAFRNIFKEAPKDAKGIDIRRLEAFRQGLGRSYRDAGGQDKYGIGIVRDEFDDFLGNTIENALVTGDQNVLQQFKDARKLFSEYRNNYFPKHKDELGKKFIGQLIENSQSSTEPFTYKQISDKIFSANQYGFKNETVNIINELRNQLGVDSPEFAGVKLDAVSKVLQPLVNNKGGLNFNNPAVQTYKNNLDKNMFVLKEILTPDEVKALRDLGDLGTATFQTRKSNINPSQSGLVLNLLSKMPGSNVVKAAINFLGVPENKAAMQASKITNPQYLEKQLQVLNVPQGIEISNGALVIPATDALKKFIDYQATPAKRPLEELSTQELVQMLEPTSVPQPRSLQDVSTDELLSILEYKKNMKNNY